MCIRDRKHIVHHAGDVHVQQEVKAGVHVAQRPAEAEQQRRQSDFQGVPCAEDHDGQRQEAEARHAVFKLPHADARGDVHDAAEAAQPVSYTHLFRPQQHKV